MWEIVGAPCSQAATEHRYVTYVEGSFQWFRSDTRLTLILNPKLVLPRTCIGEKSHHAIWSSERGMRGICIDWDNRRGG